MRKLFHLLLIFCLFLILGCGEQHTEILACEGCNIIFLNIELLRADFVEGIGGEFGSTPNLDAFFEDGIKFTQAQSPSGETLRSATATFTSQESFFNTHKSWRYRGQQEPIDLVPTIPQVLGKEGMLSYGVVQGEGLDPENKFGRGFELYQFEEEDVLIEDLVDSFITLLNPNASNQFYYFHAHSLHRPYVNSEGLLNTTKAMTYTRGKNITGEIHNVNLRLQYKGRFKDLNFKENFDKVLFNVSAGAVRRNFTLEDVEELHARYQKQVEYVDAAQVPLYTYLRKHFWNNSIIVFFSNHGEGLFDNGIIGHGVGYQATTHVPLFIHHPKMDSAVVIDTPISLVDLGPTIYDILGISVEHYVAGTSLLPLVVPEEGRKYKRKFIYGKDYQDSYIREGGWKLMVTGNRFLELYNLTVDPFEFHIVTQDHREIANRLYLIHNNKLRSELEQVKKFNRTIG